GRDLDAVVINLKSSKLIDSETLEPLSDAEVARHIADIKTFVRTQLSKAGSELAPDSIFAIHVPSMKGLALEAGSALGAPAHMDEIARFADWFSGAYGHRGAATRIASALELAERANQSLSSTARADAAVIDGV